MAPIEFENVPHWCQRISQPVIHLAPLYNLCCLLTLCTSKSSSSRLRLISNAVTSSFLRQPRRSQVRPPVVGPQSAVCYYCFYFFFYFFPFILPPPHTHTHTHTILLSSGSFLTCLACKIMFSIHASILNKCYFYCVLYLMSIISQTTEPTDIRCLCLRGLPVVLGDDPSAFFKTCSVSKSIC